MYSGRLDSHILRALDLRSRAGDWALALGTYSVTYPIPGGDPRNYATTVGIWLSDEGIDRYLRIG